MKNKFKKLLSLLAAIAVILSSVVCITMITASADDVYITKSVVDDIYNNGSTIAYKYSNYTGADGLYKMNFMDSTSGLPRGKFYMFPYVSPEISDYRCYITWKSEVDMTRFIIHTANSSTATQDYVRQYYTFYTSADGEAWSEASFTVGDKVQGYGTAAYYEVVADNLPVGTRYFKFVPLINNTNANSNGYLTGIIRAEYEYKELLLPPEIKAIYKNYYSAYANPLADGQRVERDVRIKVENMLIEGSGAEVSIKKDGSKVSADSYYNSEKEAYFFTQNGDYSVTAKNYAGEKSISFTLKKSGEQETVVTKTVVDDIYNTGKTTAIERTDYANATQKVSFSFAQASRKWYMFPYVHGDDNPAAYVIWYSDIGFGSFWVDTYNTSSAKEDYIRKFYAFYYSADGVNWTQAEYTVGERTKVGSNYSYKLTIDEIADGAKYMKFQSLITDATKDSGWCSGIIRASYTTYVLLPQINAKFEDALGGFSNPVGNGVTVPSKVQVSYNDVDSEVGGSTTVKKDGSLISLPSDGILSEDGKYEITATNVKGTVKLEFTIDSSKAQADSETYVFSEGVELATNDFNRLLGITPTGASADFTKGDNHVIVNDTGLLKYSDNLAWWGCTEGGTKLTIGSDTKGYNKDGYFYFVNVGSDGKKYTGFNITYTAAVQSGYPKDAYFSIYTADKYNGTYRLVEPSSVTMDPYTGAPAAAVFHATYYLGSEASIVKVEFHPQAPAASLWQGGFLSLLNLTKLSMPLITVTSDGKAIVDNQITRKDVEVSVSNELYYYVEKDGKEYTLPQNKKLTEDGLYTVTACNYAGTSKVSFYIAKQNPAVQLIDSSGNFLADNAVAEDDVKAVFYNSINCNTVKDSTYYSSAAELTLDLNGTYKLTAENEYGSFERTITINRPLPTLKGYNFQSAEITEGSTIVTSATYSIETYDSYTVTLNGKPYTPKEEFKLTEEGTYVIEAVNKAGKTSLSFTIKYNPPLDEVPHAGDTVVKINYHEKGRTGWMTSVYKYDNLTLDDSKALQSDWTGFTGGTLHSTIVGNTEAFVTYKTPGFKSFHLYAAFLPEKSVTAEEIYELYASSNGKDFTKLEYTLEHDISYITTGYKKYRFVANDIPDGAKYFKVVIKQNGASSPWVRCITDVEFSYNKSDAGKLDVNDILFMIEDAFDGETVETDIYNGDTVIPKKVFEALQDNDKTLKVNLINKKFETEYSLSFNGLSVTEPMDFNIGVKEGASEGQKLVSADDKTAKALIFNQKGEWTVGVRVGVALMGRQSGANYALYSYKDGQLSFVESVMADTKGFLYYSLVSNGDYIISAKTDLIKDEVSEETDTKEETQENIETKTDSEKLAPHIMVVNRRKFIPNKVAQTDYTWLIVAICAAVVVIAAVCTVLIILVKKGKINLQKGRKV